MLFRDRNDAGLSLAGRLKQYANRPDVLVLALPRGGVPVGFQVARQLNAPLDVFVVRKLGVPGHEELAFGAIAGGGVRVLNPDVVDALDITNEVIEEVAANEEAELRRREQLYRGALPPLDVTGRVVILVDDGLATGSTMRAAAAAVRQKQPQWLVVGAPVAAAHTCEQLRLEVDEVVCAATPPSFSAVGQWYWDFAQTSDQEVRELLAQGRRLGARSASTGSANRPPERVA